MEQAWKNDAEAFIGLRNDLVPGHLIEATARAMENYEVLKVKAATTLLIQMCLLRTRKATMNQTLLGAIASHPAALVQITCWKTGQDLKSWKTRTEPLKRQESLPVVSAPGSHWRDRPCSSGDFVSPVGSDSNRNPGQRE